MLKFEFVLENKKKREERKYVNNTVERYRNHTFCFIAFFENLLSTSEINNDNINKHRYERVDIGLARHPAKFMDESRF